MANGKLPLLVVGLIKERDEEPIKRFVKSIEEKYDCRVVYLFEKISEFHVRMSSINSLQEYHSLIINKLKEHDTNMFATVVTTVHHPIERYLSALLSTMGYRYIAIATTPEGEIITSQDTFTAVTNA